MRDADLLACKQGLRCLCVHARVCACELAPTVAISCGTQGQKQEEEMGGGDGGGDDDYDDEALE